MNHATGAGVEAPCDPARGEDARGAVALLPCPFCGALPTWETHPDLADAVRVACRARCGVQPETEYLLTDFVAELVERWNARPPQGLRQAR